MGSCTELPALGVNLCGKMSHRRSERFYRDGREDSAQVLPPRARLLRGSSAVHAVLQFDYGNCGEHDLGLSVLAFEYRKQLANRLGLTLGGDRHTRVKN
jgi:hypothetical protein